MTERPVESWEALQRAPVAERNQAQDSIAEMVLRVTSGGDGKEFLDWLRSITIENRNRLGATEAELRELEAKRNLVAEIERLRDEGRKIVAERSKT